MQATVTHTEWHGFPALQLAHDALRVVTVPETGGKLVSLREQVSGREWLVQPEESHPFRRLEYGAAYNPNHPGGWDEMLPTIIACHYPVDGPYHDIALPDHGEVWTLPWEEEDLTGGRVRLSVNGRALPYRLSRALALTEAGLRLDYTLHNTGPAPLYYLWAAHPQFACEPGTEILLPPDVSEVINVLPAEWGPEWGDVGTHNGWPALQTDSGPLRQDLVRGPECHRGRKVYLPPTQAISWAGLRQPDGATLSLRWDPTLLPYFGVWVDEGCLNQVSDVALEPTNAYYDDLALAWRNGRTAVVEPGMTASWQLQLELSRG